MWEVITENTFAPGFWCNDSTEGGFINDNSEFCAGTVVFGVVIVFGAAAVFGDLIDLGISIVTGDLVATKVFVNAAFFDVLVSSFNDADVVVVACIS